MPSLFKPANWLVKIDFINRLALSTNVMPVVSAAANGGKTSFSHLLQKGLDPAIHSCLVSASQEFEAVSFLKQIIIDDHSFESVNALIDYVNTQKKIFLLMIDDAQQLPVFFLEALLTGFDKYETGNYFHVCLFADLSIMDSLHSLEEKFSNYLHTIELGPLSYTETRTYISAKMRLLKPINKAWFDEFYQFTQGNLASINLHSKEFFQPQLPKNSSFKKKIRFKRHHGVVVLASFAIAMVLSLVPFKTDNLLESTIASIPLTKNSLAEVSYLPPISMILVQNLVLSFMDEKTELAANDTPIEVTDIGTSRAMYRPRFVHEKILLSSIEPIGLKSNVIKTSISATALKKEEAITNPPSSGRYTIQLVATRSRQDLKHFMATHEVSRTKVLISKRDGLDWFVLTMGAYQHKEEAQLAIQSLPNPIKALNPWIRPTRGLSEG